MLWHARRGDLFVTGCLLVGLAAGCASSGPYVWYEQMPRDIQAGPPDYLIRAGDVLNIQVLGHGDLSLRQKVRSDGRVALMLIGDVQAEGKRPSVLKAELESRLKDYIVSPSIVVNVDESTPIKVLLLGEVAHPGAFSLEDDDRLAHALALGGGLTDLASPSDVFVVRSEPRPIRIRFTLEAITRNIGGAADFRMHRNDVIEVE